MGVGEGVDFGVADGLIVAVGVGLMVGFEGVAVGVEVAD